MIQLYPLSLVSPRVQIFGRNMYLRFDLALRLLREKSAIQVFSESGAFLGIRLGNFGTLPSAPLAPAELPGLFYEDPNPHRKYARFHWQY